MKTRPRSEVGKLKEGEGKTWLRRLYVHQERSRELERWLGDNWERMTGWLVEEAWRKQELQRLDEMAVKE